MKNFCVLLFCLLSFSCLAQEKNTRVLLGVGVDSRLSIMDITRFKFHVFKIDKPRVNEQLQLKGNALGISLMAENLKLGFQYGLEYVGRYGHIYYKPGYPDTSSIGSFVSNDPVNGFTNDYLLIARKTILKKEHQLLCEAGIGIMNNRSKFQSTLYAEKLSDGTPIYYVGTYNSNYRSYIAGISFRKEWLNLSFRAHIVFEKDHKYVELRTFCIPNLVFHYQIPLSLKGKIDE